MNPRLIAALVSVAALGLGAGSVRAQSITFGVGGGLTFPTGDFDTGAKSGWHGIGHAGYGLRTGLGIRLDFFYGQNSLDRISGNTKLTGGLGSLTYAFKSAGGAAPYLIGGLGAFNVKQTSNAGGLAFTSSATRLALGAGGGVKFRAGSDSKFFVEARYISVQTTQGSTGFLPITAGISFGTK